MAIVFGPQNDTEDGSLDMTVLTQGTTITGTVVSQRAWEKALLSQVQTANENAAKGISERFEAYWGNREKIEEEVAANPLRRSQNRYIHFIAPTLISGIQHVKWQPTRVDLRDVSAWSIGSLVTK